MSSSANTTTPLMRVEFAGHLTASSYNQLTQIIEKRGNSLKPITSDMRTLSQSADHMACRAGLWTAIALAAGLFSLTGQTQTPAPALQLSKTIVLTGVTGKFDHLA